jgi:chromosome partitioning protein
MHVLAIASRKGGSGKTTLTGHLAVEAVRRGAGPVAVMDTDPQGSLADWWNERADKDPLFVNTQLETIADYIEKLRATGIGMVLIDTPPAITGAIREIVAVADMVLVPTRPSPHDLRSVGATVALVEDMEKPLVFVINGATPRARITGEAVVALSQHGPLAPSLIHQRVDFAASMIDGRTVMELPSSPAASGEISALWDYLAMRMGIGARSAAVAAHAPAWRMGGVRMAEAEMAT